MVLVWQIKNDWLNLPNFLPTKFSSYTVFPVNIGMSVCVHVSVTIYLP